jgi:hypothetical protein
MMFDLSPEDFAAIDAARFEAAVVDSIVARCGPRAASMRRVLGKRAKNKGEDCWPSFYDFYDEFSEIFRTPLYLFVKKIPKIAQKLPLHVLIERFEKTELFKEWTALADEVPADWSGPVGLAFFWPYLRSGKTTRGGALVLHNASDVSSSTGFYAQVTPGMWLEPLGSIFDRWQEHGLFQD